MPWPARVPVSCPLSSVGYGLVAQVEMTHNCPIGAFQSNSQIVHATSEMPTGAYRLAPIGRPDAPYPSAVHAGALPAPNSSVLHAPFAHAPHTARDPVSGALIVVFEGRRTIPDSAQNRCPPSRERVSESFI